MKQILFLFITLLLLSPIYGQTGKSVLSVAQKDTVKGIVSEIKLFSFRETDPDSATTFTLLRTKSAITIDSVFALVQGTSASISFHLYYGTDRTSGQDMNINGIDMVADNVTIGETFDDFEYTVIPINNMFWLSINAQANVPEEFLCVIYYH